MKHTVRVTLRPPGRGNWDPLVLVATGKHAPVLAPALAGSGLLGLRPGQTLDLGGVRWRVVTVASENPPA